MQANTEVFGHSFTGAAGRKGSSNMLSKSRRKSKTPKGSVEGAELNGEEKSAYLQPAGAVLKLTCRLHSMAA